MKQKFTVQDLARIAMGAAFLAVCSWISIPVGSVPVTLQTFAVCLITAVFGLKLGIWTVVTFILLGLAGIPVFSGFKAGIGVLAGPTGGYIIGFIFTAIIVGLATKKWGWMIPVLAAAMAVGILVCYAFGTAWFIIMWTRQSGTISLMTALGWCVFPYLLPDAVKILLAATLTPRLRALIMKGMT